jgi:hypothetical protein
LLFLAKHPLKHIESSYLQRAANSSEKLPFNKAVIHSKYKYLETANYKKQLAPYIDRFPKEQIQVFFTEDLAKYPTKVVKSGFQFIGVSPDLSEINFQPQNVSLHKNYDRSITKILRQNKYLNNLAKQSSSALKRILKKVFTKHVTQKPLWEKRTLDCVLNAIWQNSESFLEQHGKSKTFWDLKEYLTN